MVSMMVANAIAASWLGVAGVAVLLGLAGYGLIVLHRRELARQRAHTRVLDMVPPELRFEAEPLRFRVAGVSAAVAAAAGGGAAAGTPGLLIAGGLVVVPLCMVALRHRRHHQRTVISAVKHRADDMSREELRELVAGLEISHGKAEMRPLRRLADRA
jgi:hypothetical protein